jgi:hypothetical protein
MMRGHGTNTGHPGGQDRHQGEQVRTTIDQLNAKWAAQQAQGGR